MKDRVIKWMLGSILCMNAIDAIASLVFIKHLAVLDEANPIAGLLMKMGDVPFVIAKTLVVSTGVYILWEHRQKPIAMLGAYASFITYLSLMVGFYLFLS